MVCHRALLPQHYRIQSFAHDNGNYEQSLYSTAFTQTVFRPGKGKCLRSGTITVFDLQDQACIFGAESV